MDRDLFFICLFMLTARLFENASSQTADNTPPVMWLDRTWRIPSTEKVGAVVTRVRAEDQESDALEFGLEPINDIPIPFRIDNTTGVVYLNESIEERVGENLFLYVTVSDGKLTAKNEVWVTIVNGTGGGRTPSLPNNGPHRPPYLQLPPGFSNNRRPPLPPPLPSNPFFNGAVINNYPSMSLPPPPSLFPPNFSLNMSNHKPQTKTYVDIDNNIPIINSTLATKSTVTIDTTGEENTKPSTEATVTDETTTSKKPSNETTKQVIDVSNNIDNEDKNNTSGDDSKIVKPNHDVLFTVIPIVAVILVFIIVGVVSFFVWRKYFFKKTKSKEDMSKEPSGGIVLQEDPSVALQGWRGPRAFSNRYEPWENGHIQATEQSSLSAEKAADAEDRWEFPRHRLRVFNIVGEGAFGQVWRCDATEIDGLKGVSTVAVKTLKENASEKEKLDLIQELNVMKSLEPHPNVVRLLGCCTEKEPVFVIMEYISLGKLQSYLRSSRAERYYGNTHGCSKTLTSRDLTSFAYQVARGMDFLSSKGIIHRDLAARNVLINDEHKCKVADFGFARDVLSSLVYERKSDGRLPIRWMAPESLYDDIFSVKSDVWSFGVFLWEVVTLGSTPYPGLSAGDVMRKVRDGHRLEKPEHCRRELYNIMYYCWDADPAQRPSFSECVSLLEKLLMTETDYIELERFPDHSYYNVSSLSGEKL